MDTTNSQFTVTENSESIQFHIGETIGRFISYDNHWSRGTERGNVIGIRIGPRSLIGRRPEEVLFPRKYSEFLVSIERIAALFFTRKSIMIKLNIYSKSDYEELIKN